MSRRLAYGDVSASSYAPRPQCSLWSRFSASKGMQERSEPKETRMAMSLLVIMVQGSDCVAVDVQGILDGTDVLTPLVECPGTASLAHAEAKAI